MTPPRERLRGACHLTKWPRQLDWSIVTTDAGLELRCVVKDAKGEKIHTVDTFEQARLVGMSDDELAKRLAAIAARATAHTLVGAPRGRVIQVDQEKAEVTLAMADETIASVEVGQEFRLR